MLDKAIDTITTADAYYFQLYPLSLSVSNPDCELPAPGTTYRFTVLKGIFYATQVNRNSMRPNFQSKPTSEM